MQEWLYKRGVATHEEVDQRIFPTTNDSQTIIDCFEKEMDTLGIELIRNCAVKKIVKSTDWLIHTDNRNTRRRCRCIQYRRNEKRLAPTYRTRSKDDADCPILVYLQYPR